MAGGERPGDAASDGAPGGRGEEAGGGGGEATGQKATKPGGLKVFELGGPPGCGDRDAASI